MSVRLGHAVVSRAVELQVEMRTGLFAQTPPEAWHQNAALLAPTFWNPDTDQWRIAIQTWVIEVDGLTVLVDTGVGNDRDRPHMPPLDHLRTGFLAGLGVAPQDVDVVVNTHLHTDHVGWNTHLVDGAWVPTFPNARYLMPEADHRFFAPDAATTNDGMRMVFADSILPVSAQTELFSGDHRISDSLWLRPAAGHTPGSSVLWLDAGVPAVFVGDLTHCPIQIPRSSDPCAFDVSPDEAAATRRRIFTEAARRRAAVIPAHYPGRGAARLVARGDRFAVDDWLEFEPI
ncbi:MBL fold metallo-hydrolase [Mycobacterium sp. MS1601]|uniref:MBL fold metallo-hydrolase n=1 Tax=Mycobacterium sp. MS1601 TaxID=1936029 RepID=UPI000979778B|nr:MBL fold metallo-hydrolase [Mycobacterium sp. MS1601]AQA02885.1 MBL fold metallo-hydrolase [Mycobacterium sp. MS1601]